MNQNRKQITDNLIAIIGDRGSFSGVNFAGVNGGLEISVDVYKPAASLLKRFNYAGLDCLPKQSADDIASNITSFSFVAPNEHEALVGTSSGLRSAIVQSFVDDVAKAQALLPTDRQKDFSNAMIKEAAEAIAPKSRGRY